MMIGEDFKYISTHAMMFDINDLVDLFVRLFAKKKPFDLRRFMRLRRKKILLEEISSQILEGSQITIESVE